MLLMAVTLAFGMSSCSSDDDDDEPLPNDGWGQVDDEDEPSGGDGPVQTGVAGYWNITSETADSTARIGLRLAEDGKATYEHFTSDGHDNVKIVAKGEYTVAGSKLILDYTDMTVISDNTDNYYWGYEDGVQKYVVYDILAMPTATNQKLILTTFDDRVMMFDKFSDVNSLRDKLPGHWSSTNSGYNFTEDFTFTEDGGIVYEIASKPGKSRSGVTAKGTYTLTDDLKIIARYDDISVDNSNGSDSFNEFTDGGQVTVTYDLIPKLSLDIDEGFVLRYEHNLLELEKQADVDEPGVDGNPLVGTWRYGNVMVNGKTGIVQIVFSANGTGHIEVWYDEGGFDIYPFEYAYFEDKDENRWYVEFIWTGQYSIMFQDGVDYEVTITTSRLLIGDYLFERQ